MSHPPALAARRASLIVRVLNPVIGRLLRAGLPFGPNVLLTVRGRSRGRLHTFPVAIISLDNRRFIQSPWGEVNGVRNLRVAGEAILSHGRHRDPVRAMEIAPEEGGAILRGGLARYLDSPILSLPVKAFFGLDRHSPPEAFVAVARAHPMFELREGPALEPAVA